MSSQWKRTEALASVRTRLWRYLCASARPEDVGERAEELWQLPRDELKRLWAAHFLLLPSTSEMLEAAARVLRELPSSAVRSETELIGAVRGTVNWPRTVQRQLGTSDPTRYVCRPIERRYDTPLARLVLLALRRCVDLGEVSDLAAQGAAGAQVSDAVAEAARLLGHTKLRAVTAVDHLPERTLESLQRHRHTEPLIRFVRSVREGLGDMDPATVEATIASQLLGPATDDVLFELMTGFDILDGLTRRGFTHLPHLVTGGAAPFASLSGRAALTIWWQRSLWTTRLAGKSPSRYTETLEAAVLGPGRLRPDFIVSSADPARLLLVEVKQTAVAGARPEKRGVLEALAYLHDAEEVLRSHPYPHALVVGWSAPATAAPGRIVVASQSTIDEAIGLVLDEWAI